MSELYNLIRARYVLYLRKLETQAIANAKVKDDRDRLNSLKEEKQKLIMKFIEGKANANDKKRLNEINDEIMKLQNTINQKIKKETKLSRRLGRKVRAYDEAIIPMLDIDYESEVRQPVRAALESGQPELAEIVVVRGGARPAEGGRRGQ